MQDINRALAGEIRAEMARQEKTLEQLAEALGVHRMTASRLRSGQTALAVDQLDVVATWLGSDAVSLLASALARSAA